jgi:2-iminobutanoate/2-iminopropanoate deaminase
VSFVLTLYGPAQSGRTLSRNRTPDMTRLLPALVLIAASACAPARPAPEYLPAPGPAARPFSPAVRANGFLFLAGQLGTDSTGRLAAGGIQPETRQAMQNVRALLARSGSSLDRVVKCTVFLADVAEWGAMNEVYTTFCAPGRVPARTALGVGGLPLGARVEIECLAAD